MMSKGDADCRERFSIQVGIILQEFIAGEISAVNALADIKRHYEDKIGDVEEGEE